MESGVSKHPNKGYGGEPPRRAYEDVSDDVEGAATRAITGPLRVEPGVAEGAEDYKPARGYGGETAERGLGDDVSDDVEAAAQHSVAGPRRVEEGALYNVDVKGRAHRAEGATGKGAFLSNNERALIDANADLIEENAAAQRAAHDAYQAARDSGLDEAAANAAAEAAYAAYTDTERAENEDDESESVEELADAIESGEVSHDEAANTIAELTTQLDQVTHERDDLAEKVASLEQEIAKLNARLNELLERLNQPTQGEDEENPESRTKEVAEEGDREDIPPAEGSDAVFTEADQRELQRRLAEEEGQSRDSEATPERSVDIVLQQARERYAKLTADDRLSYLGRFLQSDTMVSRALRKVPGVSWLVDKVNNDSYKALVIEDARIEYEEAVRNIEAMAEDIAETEGLSLEQLQQARVRLQIGEEHELTKSILEQQMSMGKGGNKFTDWWVRHNGIGGKILKAGVVVGASLITGGAAGAVAAGVFGAAAAAGLAGAGVGALTGGGIAKHVTDRRARSFIDKTRTRTVAEHEMRQDARRIEEELRGSEPRRAVEGEAIPINEARPPQRAMGPDWVQRMTGVIEARTNEIVKDNRRRMKTAVGLGAAAGSLAGNAAGNFIDSWMHSAGQNGSVDAHPNEGTNPNSRYDQMLKGHEFRAEPGSSVIKEIQQAAHANGHNISMHKAEEIYNHIYHQVGDKIIHGGPEYHGPTGDIRFGEPGMYAWGKGVLEQIVSLAGK